MRQIDSAHQTPVGSVVQRVEMLPMSPAITPFNTPESAPGRPLHPTDLNDFLQREEQAHATTNSVSATALEAGLRRNGSGGFKERVMQLREQRRSRQVSRHRSVDSISRSSFKDNDAEASDENEGGGGDGSLYGEGERDDSESDDFTSEEDVDRHERDNVDDPAGDAFSDEGACASVQESCSVISSCAYALYTVQQTIQLKSEARARRRAGRKQVLRTATTATTT
jgi:hypothetical protein